MANPRHSENGDAYETLGEYSNVLENSGFGGMFGSMRNPMDIFQQPDPLDDNPFSRLDAQSLMRPARR